MLKSAKYVSRRSLVGLFTCAGLLLTGCKKEQPAPAPAPSTNAPPSPAPAAAPAAAAPAEQKGANLKLDDPKAAIALLEESQLKLEGAQGDCAFLAEDGNLGAVVKKARSTATNWSVKCDAGADAKTWACKADFKRAEEKDSEAGEFALTLEYKVDDATRAIDPASLTCQVAG
ncbi:MAG TPA: hypothetical protein VK447_04755 [Myxococcaceae bacterium]|nr:hypothetical protein [Myxococcaceae bacterium]